MGSSLSTSLQEALAKELHAKARALLKKLFNKDVGDNTKIEAVLENLAIGHFKNVYDYDLKTTESDPVKPPTSLGINKLVTGFVDATGADINNHVGLNATKAALGPICLPNWMADLAEAELSGIVSTLVGQDTGMEWKMKEYTRTYDARIEDKDSYKCDAVILYCNAAETGFFASASNCVIYFIGVYYSVESKRKKSRDDLERAAYATAVNDLLPSFKVPTNNKELTDLLDTYAEMRFESEFQYKYTVDPPESLRITSHDAMLGRNSHTYYIPDFGPKLFEVIRTDNKDKKPKSDPEPPKNSGSKEDTKPKQDAVVPNVDPDSKEEGKGQKEVGEDHSNAPETMSDEQSELQRHVEMHIFKGMNVEIDSLRNQAINDVVGLYKSILKETTTNSWTVNHIDQSYKPADPTQNSIRQSGIVISWFGYRNTPDDARITVHYIYFKTIVYEEVKVEELLAKGMLKQLCLNMQAHIPESTLKETLKQDPVYDRSTMRDLVSAYAKARWHQIHKFNFDGAETKPRDLKGNGLVTFEKFFYFPTYPATRQMVEELMNRELFLRTIPAGTNDPLFPKHARSALYDDICGHIFDYASLNAAKHVNFWSDGDHIFVVVDTSAQHKDVKHYSFYMYAVADMALAKKVRVEEGKALQQGMHSQFFYVYYLGVMCSFSPLEW